MINTNNSSISTLKNQFDQLYFEHINESNPQKVEGAIAEMLDLQTKMGSATSSRFSSLSAIFNWVSSNTNTFSVDKINEDVEIKLAKMFSHSTNLYSQNNNPHTFHIANDYQACILGNGPIAQSDKKNAIDYATGFSNMSNNCWANSLLSMVICVPSFKEAYVTVANYYANSGDNVASGHGKALQNALVSYEWALSKKQPVDQNVSQNVRLAFAYLFGELMFSTSCHNPEDAGEALQMLMGRYEQILREKNKENHGFSSLYCPLETKRCYQPMGEQRAADPYKDYSKIQPDHSASAFCNDYQILIDLQGKEHLSFEALLSGYFINSSVEDCEKSTYLIDNGFVQDFKLVEERRQFKAVPNEFFLTLKRFKQENNGTRHKICSGVNINRVIALPEIATDQNKPITYELDSFILHSGGFGGGHYICFKKVDGRWIEANDSRVSFRENWEIDQILHNSHNSSYTSYLHHYTIVPEVAQAAAIESVQLAMRPETVITVKCPNLSSNQTLSIRGSGAGLNWNSCVELAQIDWETFEFKTNVPFNGELEYKLLIDGTKWEKGANHKITNGKRAECVYSFEGHLLPPLKKTVIEVSCYAPSGKALSLSGTGPLGNWDQLIPMHRIGHSDRWYVSFEGELPPFQYKLRLSTGEWEQGNDRSATCGKKEKIHSPHF